MSRLGLETIILTEPNRYRLGVAPYRITIREGIFEDVVISDTLNGSPIADLFPISGTVTTTDATPTTLLTTAVVTNGARLLKADIVLVSSTADIGAFRQACKVVNNAGTLTLSAPFDVTQILDAALATVTATFVVSSTNVIVQVVGVAATTIHWRCTLESCSTTF